MDLKKFKKMFDEGEMKFLGKGGSKETYLHVGTNFVYKRPRVNCGHSKLQPPDPASRTAPWVYTPCFDIKCVNPMSYGAFAITREVLAYKTYGKTGEKALARCRQLADGWSIMENVDPLDHESLNKMIRIPSDAHRSVWDQDLKPEYKWLHNCKDGWQVGLNRKGKLVEYDYTDYVEGAMR